jgi:uncharacterized protein
MTLSSANDWIEHLQLQKHIEGGWYKETYRSPLLLQRETAPHIVNGDRSLCTHIYFLLQQHEFSALHRIGSDELWHFYDGDRLVVYEIDTSGRLTEHQLGKDPSNAVLPFCMIRKGSWFGSRVATGGKYALVGCTVAPGFDFADFELAGAGALSQQFPMHKDLIASLCRK